jgi:thiosulfate/3-mercaptopyruvate sulfurtransferase
MAGAKDVPPASPISERGYAQPDVLVSTSWVAEHLEDAAVRIVESDEDVLLYETGHIPGAVKIDWVADLNDALVRDYVDRDQFTRLLRSRGINDDTTIVFYGDKDNWWATYAFWAFRLFGLRNLKVMDGGRQRWSDEGRPLETAAVMDGGRLRWPAKRRLETEGTITVPERNDRTIRAFRDDVLAHVQAHHKLVDVRSPEEYRGERMHMQDYPNEGALRGGHIPGAANIPWSRAVDPHTHCFRSASDLRTIYQQEHGLDTNDDIIAYCRIGERSSHSWFVLTYLLGYTRVRNYDGSWTEWGNLVRAPIEKP